jgi:hypothetical protein
VRYMTAQGSGNHGYPWLNYGTTLHHSAIDCPPFKALYGYEINSGVTLPLSDWEQSEATNLLHDQEAQLANLKQHLAAAQNRM